MTNEVKLFAHEQFGAVRVIMKDGEPWFVASDIAKALGYADPSRAVVQHCKKSTKSTILANHQDGKIVPPVNVSIIPETDVYRLVMRSNLPSAESFQDWVCEEVLPSIRKTGSYTVSEKGIFIPDFTDPVAGCEAWLAEKKANLAMQKEIAKAQNALSEAIAIAQNAEDHRHMLDDKRAATAMGRCGGYVKDRDRWKGKAERAESLCEDLKDELGDSKNWKTVKAIPWLREAFKREAFEGRQSATFYRAMGRILSSISSLHNQPKKKSPDGEYGMVNRYHISVIEFAEANLIDFCRKNHSVASSTILSLANPAFWGK